MRLKALVCMLSSLWLLPAQAHNLWLISDQKAWQFQADGTPVLRSTQVPRDWSPHFPISQQQELFHRNAQEDWFKFDLSGKNQLMFRGASLGKGFTEIYPNPGPQATYYAGLIGHTGLQVFQLSPHRAPQRILPRADLYTFAPHPQGGYVFVTWDSRGQESEDFIDWIIGKKMRLWYQPAKGVAKQIGHFDSIQDLHIVDQGRQLVFFIPGKTPQGLSWKLIRLSLTAPHTPLLVAEVAKPATTRGTPLLAAWPHLDWVVYAPHIQSENQEHIPQTLVRQRLGHPPQQWHSQSSRTFAFSWSPAGYISRELPAQEHLKTTECWQVSSGEKVAEYHYNWQEINPERAICTD